MYLNKLSLATILEKNKNMCYFPRACMCEFPYQEGKSLCKNKRQQNIVP